MGMVLHASALFVLTKPLPECTAPVLILSVWRKNEVPSQVQPRKCKAKLDQDPTEDKRCSGAGGRMKCPHKFCQDLDLMPQKTNDAQDTREAGALN